MTCQPPTFTEKTKENVVIEKRQPLQFEGFRALTIPPYRKLTVRPVALCHVGRLVHTQGAVEDWYESDAGKLFRPRTDEDDWAQRMEHDDEKNDDGYVGLVDLELLGAEAEDVYWVYWWGDDKGPMAAIQECLRRVMTDPQHFGIVKEHYLQHLEKEMAKMFQAEEYDEWTYEQKKAQYERISESRPEQWIHKTVRIFADGVPISHWDFPGLTAVRFAVAGTAAGASQCEPLSSCSTRPLFPLLLLRQVSGDDVDAGKVLGE